MNLTKLTLPLLVALAYGASPVLAGPILGSNLASFAVLGATGVTNVPTSTIGGNLGSAPNASVGGGYVFSFGSLQANTLIAQNAQVELDAAILALAAFGPGITITAGDLDAFQASNGGTIGPGTYTVPAASVNLMGALLLDGGGSNNAVFVFQFPSTLITSSTSTVIVQNVGDGANVGLYFNVSSAATLNGPTFAGNVLAKTVISSDGNLTLDCGRLLSSESQVTLIQDNISTGCLSVGLGSNGFDQGGNVIPGGPGGSGIGVIPEPGTVLLFGLGFAGLLLSRKSAVNRV